MTDIDDAYKSLLRAGPRTPPAPDWEARRHQNEVRFWAAHLDDLVLHLPGLRRYRGKERAARLMADVLEEIKATEGLDAGVIAHDRLIDRWRDRREAVRARTGSEAGPGARP